MKSIYSIVLMASILILTSSCGGKVDPNKQIDEGNVENNTYTSQEMGWTIEIPKGWQAISKEESIELKEVGANSVGESMGEKVAVSTAKDLISFKKDNLNTFQSTTEPFESNDKEEWRETNLYVKDILYNAYMDQGYKKIDSSKVTIVKIDGVDFLSYSFALYASNGKIVLNQILYSNLRNGHDFAVGILYNNEKDKKTMLNAWLNSTFK